MNAVLERFGFPTHAVGDYRRFIGDGIEMLVRRTVPEEHLDDQTLQRCLEAVRQEYSKRWAEKTKPYPGVVELLDELDSRGILKAILSNKPDDFTKLTVKTILPGFSFEVVRGLKPSVPKKPDPTGALQIAEQLRIPPAQILYLGDTNTDMKTATAAGMYPVGALWGFRDKAELLQSGAKAVINHPTELLELL